MRTPIYLLFAAAFAIGPCARTARAQSEPPNAYELQEEFLSNFAEFTEWPKGTFANSKSPITLCILGKDPFGPLLEQAVAGKTVHGRRLAIERHYKLQSLQGCQILFVSSPETPRLPKILHALRGTSVLTVGNSGLFAELGGVVQLIPQGNGVLLEINVDAAERARLKLSSKLLAVAIILREGPHAKQP